MIVGIIPMSMMALLASSQADQPSTCIFPLATKREVALGIFNAIADGQPPWRKRRAYKTKIVDEGKSWSIFQELKGGDHEKFFVGKDGQHMETIKSTARGGGLEMTIDKCTAAISNSGLSR